MCRINSKWKTICFRLVSDHLIPFIVHLIPTGTPTLIKAFLCVVEIISFFFRVISLGTRLFANLVAGHVLLGLIASNLLSLLNYFSFSFRASTRLDTSLKPISSTIMD